MSEDKDIQQEAIMENQGKSDLEQRVSAGINGGFELKKGEKNRFLGEFRERVLKALTFEQVEEPGTYPEVLEAIKNNEAKKLIINRKVDMDRAKDYIRLAREHDLSFKKVDSPDFKGDIGLVVVSDHAVNQSDIIIKDRVTSLKEQGLPIELINATGEKVCEECYQMIKEKAPEELENYRKMNWLDKIIGKKCPANH
ncbi:uncharacterized protein YueI [Orenia metallireducens]|uniref:Uncharacterized protein YueI n=1 Tax=Orenia metallireducens TaxID=1413210 RepID=A0A285GNV5_9FIRM|nr:YueI family protein [Orenia metallireducens]PRX35755.1 uncharacterized protein YueI [Orenia metallireducens]SNY24186.1 Uncharacterized protein YueI [Orenia metallireducens]